MYVVSRAGCDILGQSGRIHPGEEAYHEVAEGQVAWLGQQSRQALAVQGDLRQEHKGRPISTSAISCFVCWHLDQEESVRLADLKLACFFGFFFLSRSTCTKCELWKWWTATRAAIAARWPPRTSVTAAPSRCPCRVRRFIALLSPFIQPPPPRNRLCQTITACAF